MKRRKKKKNRASKKLFVDSLHSCQTFCVIPTSLKNSCFLRSEQLHFDVLRSSDVIRIGRAITLLSIFAILTLIQEDERQDAVRPSRYLRSPGLE